MSDIREYLAQFDGKVSLLVLRESYYSFSSEALLIMTREAGSMINAVAYVDRSPQDKLLSEYAEKTYLRNIPVQSFQSQDEAASWFEQYGPLPSRL
ncbi:hypothetical protein [Solemya velesiana gill symbiont]|nr:hypothetical protein [Solemya velesiana gill symbiont]